MKSKLPQCSGFVSHAWLEAEKLRRLFWASWITNVINSDHYISGSAADTMVLAMPLPVSEDAYRLGTEEPLVSLSQSFAKYQNMPSGDLGEPSIMSELIKILLLW